MAVGYQDCPSSFPSTVWPQASDLTSLSSIPHLQDANDNKHCLIELSWRIKWSPVTCFCVFFQVLVICPETSLEQSSFLGSVHILPRRPTLMAVNALNSFFLPFLYLLPCRAGWHHFPPEGKSKSQVPHKTVCTAPCTQHWGFLIKHSPHPQEIKSSGLGVLLWGWKGCGGVSRQRAGEWIRAKVFRAPRHSAGNQGTNHQILEVFLSHYRPFKLMILLWETHRGLPIYLFLFNLIFFYLFYFIEGSSYLNCIVIEMLWSLYDFGLDDNDDDDDTVYSTDFQTSLVYRITCFCWSTRYGKSREFPGWYVSLTGNMYLALS